MIRQLPKETHAQPFVKIFRDINELDILSDRDKKKYILSFNQTEQVSPVKKLPRYGAGDYLEPELIGNT